MSFVSSQTLRNVTKGGRDGRHHRILEAARTVFSEKGYVGGEVEEIARRARIGKATLYREFNSKKDLFLSVVTDGIEQLRNAMVSAVSMAGEPSRVFGEAVRSALTFFESNRSLVRVLLLEAGELRGEIIARYFDRYLAARSAADAIFKKYPAAPALSGRSPGELADVLMYLLAGRVMVWALLDEERPLAQDADLILHTYVNGVFAHPAENPLPFPQS